MTSAIADLLAAADALSQKLEQLQCDCSAAKRHSGHRSNCMPALRQAGAALQVAAEHARQDTQPVDPSTPSGTRIDAAAQYLAQNVLRLAWDGLRTDGRCTDGGWRPFGAGQHMNVRQEDYRDAARGILRAAGVEP